MSCLIEYYGTFPLAPGTKPQDILVLALTHEVADLISPDTLLADREIEIVDGTIEGRDANKRFSAFLKAAAPMLLDNSVVFAVPGGVLGSAGALMARNGTLYYAEAALIPVTPWRPAE